MTINITYWLTILNVITIAITLYCGQRHLESALEVDLIWQFHLKGPLFASLAVLSVTKPSELENLFGIWCKKLCAT